MDPQLPSVLLIDDNPALLELIKIISEQSREMTVQTAQSAKEALTILTQKSFDAIIVDYDMPEISGIGFLKILRKQGDTTPVIVFTGIGGENAAIEALNNGANFLLKKGDDPRYPFRELVTMVKKAMERSSMGSGLGTTQKIIVDLLNFSSDPSFAIDRDGKVVAWNEPMEELTGVTSTVMMGKGKNIYSEPFFGMRKKMLVNLVFDSDDEIKHQKYMLISRVAKGPVVAVTRGVKKSGGEWTLWMKAQAVYDSQGQFIASIGVVRDVTATFKDVIVGDSQLEDAVQLEKFAATDTKKQKTGLFGKILGKTSPQVSMHYEKGVRLYVQEKKYAEAIAEFDTALEEDKTHAQAWNDRGSCFRELGDHANALKSLLRAVELAPDNPEYLTNLGETLETIGVMNKNHKYLNSAVQVFNRVLHEMPFNSNAWNHIGVCLKEMGKADESKFYFDRAQYINVWREDTPIKRKCDEYLTTK